MKLNVKKLRECKETIIISSKDALSDVIKIAWSEEIINGNKKITIRSRKIKETKAEYFNDKNVIVEKEKVRCKERYGAIVCLYLDYLASSEIDSDVVNKSKKFVKVMNRR